MFKTTFAATIIAVSLAAGAQAATLSGFFEVTAVNATGLNSSESEATIDNFIAAQMSGTTTTFQYEGLLDFRSVGGNPTVYEFLDTGTGNLSGITEDSMFGMLTNSSPNISNGTATSTFYLFQLTDVIGSGSFTVTHDDGASIFEDGVELDNNAPGTGGGTALGPTAETTTQYFNFMGGDDFSLLYVSTNGNPSILEVDGDLAPVPVPAAGLLLLGGLGALGVIRRRRKS